MRPMVMLDRDGTVIRHVHHLVDPCLVELLPGAAEAIAVLREEELPVVIVTNQSVVGRGMLDARGLEEVHRVLEEALGALGAKVDGIYVCPHLPCGGCRCRKPAPELGIVAARDFEADLRWSFVVGDTRSDMEFARALGARAIGVRTGLSDHPSTGSDLLVDDLPAAASLILEELRCLR